MFDFFQLCYRGGTWARFVLQMVCPAHTWTQILRSPYRLCRALLQLEQLWRSQVFLAPLPCRRPILLPHSPISHVSSIPAPLEQARCSIFFMSTPASRVLSETVYSTTKLYLKCEFFSFNKRKSSHVRDCGLLTFDRFDSSFIQYLFSIYSVVFHESVSIRASMGWSTSLPGGPCSLVCHWFRHACTWRTIILEQAQSFFYVWYCCMYSSLIFHGLSWFIFHCFHYLIIIYLIIILSSYLIYLKIRG